MSKKTNANTVRRVLALIRPYTGWVVLTLSLALITVVTTLLAPVITGRAVDLILGPGAVDFAGVAKLAAPLGTRAAPKPALMSSTRRCKNAASARCSSPP